MAIKHLYIVRHGETDFNLKGIIQGRLIDADLNETGQNQAKRNGKDGERRDGKAFHGTQLGQKR